MVVVRVVAWLCQKTYSALTRWIREIWRDVVQSDVLERLQHDGHGKVVSIHKRNVVVRVSISSVESEFCERHRYVTLHMVNLCRFVTLIKLGCTKDFRCGEV